LGGEGWVHKRIMQNRWGVRGEGEGWGGGRPDGGVWRNLSSDLARSGRLLRGLVQIAFLLGDNGVKIFCWLVGARLFFNKKRKKTHQPTKVSVQQKKQPAQEKQYMDWNLERENRGRGEGGDVEREGGGRRSGGRWEIQGAGGFLLSAVIFGCGHIGTLED